jgi:hypothetical protein
MIKLIDILNEYKINSPTTNFYFVDNGSETYYLDNRLEQDKYSGYGLGDEYIIFTFPINKEGYYNTKDFDGERDPLGLVKAIELHQSGDDFDPDFDIVFFKAFITNLVQAKIPIRELYLGQDGGTHHFINLTLLYKNIQKYIIPLDRAPDWFKPID